MYDITVLTASKFLNPVNPDWYTQQVLVEDNYVMEALFRKGLKVIRTNWDNPDFDWTKTRYILFRTIWDYFDRFDEFSLWLDRVKNQTNLNNPYSLIRWNMDKHYLQDLKNMGINVPPTLFVEPGENRTLNEVIAESDWDEFILKPAVSGAGRHTYRLNLNNINKHETVYQQLIAGESMLLQEFQHNVITKGEVAFMLFGGQFSHAVLKKAKPGDFRVQDDFGGSVYDFIPSDDEIKFAEQVVSLCDPVPVYARVDVIWDNKNMLCVSELELIEPELWFRRNPLAADLLAEKVIELME